MIGRRKELMQVDTSVVVALVVVALMLVAHWKMRDADLSDLAKRIPVWLRPLILTFIIISILFTILSGDGRAFIYFQF
jgi:hypothetical protein